MGGNSVVDDLLGGAKDVIETVTGEKAREADKKAKQAQKRQRKQQAELKRKMDLEQETAEDRRARLKERESLLSKQKKMRKDGKGSIATGGEAQGVGASSGKTLLGL